MLFDIFEPLIGKMQILSLNFTCCTTINLIDKNSMDIRIETVENLRLQLILPMLLFNVGHRICKPYIGCS